MARSFTNQFGPKGATNAQKYSDYSPIKKTDPNTPYAQRQKMIMKQVDQKSHSSGKPASASVLSHLPAAGFRNQLTGQGTHQSSFDSNSFTSTLQSNLSSHQIVMPPSFQHSHLPSQQQQDPYYGGGGPGNNMKLQQLFQDKQRLEQEYQKIPITINKKSMQLQKRKEELEFELDAIEKSIARISGKSVHQIY